MGSRPFPEIACMLCSKPVNLRTDLCADERGKAIHEECYVNSLLAAPAGLAEKYSLTFCPIYCISEEP
jgi:hypothetical protein